MAKKKYRKKKFYIRNVGVTATFSMALVLFLIGILTLTLFITRDMTDYVKENLSLTVVLNDKADEQQTKRIESFLTKSKFAKSVEYISKEDALKEHIEYLGEDPQAFLGFNPLFALFEVKLNAEYANTDSVAMIEKQLARFKKSIDEIGYQKDVIAEVNENIKKITIILLGLTTILLLISFVLINNTVRLRVYSNRFIISTMKLVGAKAWFIRKPYIKQSIINGLVAAIIAIIMLAGLLFYFAYSFDLNLQLIKQETLLIVGGVVLVSGILLTAVSSYFAVGRYIRMRTDDIYYV
ncbi:MAG TPA: cell division protein FtsX [Bacteroidales bacterium]|nr:cell division protein FtsX [Bacteroidales bacterium]